MGNPEFTVKVQKLGRVVIPKPLRNKFNIEHGDTLTFSIEEIRKDSPP